MTLLSPKSEMDWGFVSLLTTGYSFPVSYSILLLSAFTVSPSLSQHCGRLWWEKRFVAELSNLMYYTESLTGGPPSRPITFGKTTILPHWFNVSSAYHGLPTNLRVTSKLGYNGIEIFNESVIPNWQLLELKNATQRQTLNHLLIKFDEVRRLLFASLPAPLELDSTAFQYTCAVATFYLCTSYKSISYHLLQPLRDFENFKSADTLM